MFILLVVSWGFTHSQSRITYFYATSLVDSIRLNLTITVGNSCAGWQVLKGNDSISFNPIYTYPGICGNVSYAESYSYTDFSPNKTSPNYYRILVPPADYSPILRVDLAKNFSNLLIYPQPAETMLYISSNEIKNTNYEMRIYDRFGRKMADIISYTYDVIGINVSAFPLGVYAFYIIGDNGNAWRGKFLKN